MNGLATLVLAQSITMCLDLLLFVTVVFWYSIAAKIFIFIMGMFIVACIM